MPTPLIAFYYIILLIGFIIGLSRYKYLDKPFVIVTALMGLTFLSELISKYFAHKYRNSNPPYHIYTIVEYLAFASVFWYLITNKLLKKWVLISLVCFPLLSILNSIIIQPLSVTPTNTIILSYTLLSMYSLIYFRQMLNEPIPVNIIKQESFWFNTAILIYCTSSFYTLAFINYHHRHKISNSIINSINLTTNYLFYSILGLSIWLNSLKREKKYFGKS